MSLLLEALQRADSERKNQGDVPGIDTPHAVASPTTPGNSRQWMLTALALIILLLLAYVIYLQTSSRHSDTVAAADETLAIQDNESVHDNQQKLPTAQNSEPAATPQPVTTAQQTKPKTTQADVAALYERLKSENASSPETASQGSIATTVGEQPSTNFTEDLVRGNQAQDAVIDQQNAAEEVYSSIPFASQLPVQQQDSIPSLRYTTHGYAEATGKGLVTLNGRSQRRGDTIAPGLVLLDIRADYIVLDMNGVLFRLPAATDWN